MFENTVQKTHIWINDTLEELRWSDARAGYLALRSVLHALRDRLTVEEAVQLAAQLPMLVRGFYYEGWHPAGKPVHERSREQFLEPIREAFQKERGEDVAAEEVARAVFKVIAMHITIGEVDDIVAILPHHIRDLWPAIARTR